MFESFDTLKNNYEEKVEVKSFIKNVLGLTLELIGEKIIEITPEIQQLLDARLQARANKDWKRADEIRDQLKNLGFEVKDTKI